MKFAEAKAQYKEKWNAEYPEWPKNMNGVKYDEFFDDYFRCCPNSDEKIEFLKRIEQKSDGDDSDIARELIEDIKKNDGTIYNLYSSDDEVDRLKGEVRRLKEEIRRLKQENKVNGEAYVKKDFEVKRELVRAYGKIADLERDLDMMLDEIFSYKDEEKPEFVRYNYKFRLVQNGNHGIKKEVTA